MSEITFIDGDDRKIFSTSYAATHVAIDFDGVVCEFAEEPSAGDSYWHGFMMKRLGKVGNRIINWRECCWEIEDAMEIELSTVIIDAL